jgi:hypothetical protein
MEIDRWIIDRTDALVGRLQDRGVPLPIILSNLGVGLVAGALLHLGFLLYDRYWMSALMIAVGYSPAIIRIAGEMRGWGIDAERFADRDPGVYVLYRTLAFTARNAEIWTRRFILAASSLGFVYLVAGALGLIHLYVPDCTFLLSMTLIGVFFYARCAMPRWPNPREERAPEHRLSLTEAP